MKIKYFISGLNLNRIPDSLSRRGFSVTEIKKSNACISFCVQSKAAAKVSKYLDEINCKYNRKYCGITARIRAYCLRFGLIAGLVLIVAAAIWISGFILKIDIQCNDVFVAEKVKQILSDKNVKLYCAKSFVDAADLKKNILRNVEGLSYTEVRIVGSVLRIIIREELPKPDIVGLDDGNLIATCDAVITRIVCIKGTAVVNVGQAVRAGTVLIEGYTKIGEEYVSCCALGEVYGKVYIGEKLTVTGTVIEKRRTGKTETVSALVLRGNAKLAKSTFESFDTETTEAYISDILPAKIVTAVYYETVNVETPVDINIQKALLIKEAQKRVKLRLPENADIKRNWAVEKKVDNLYIIDVYYEIEQKISEAA